MGTDITTILHIILQHKYYGHISNSDPRQEDYKFEPQNNKKCRIAEANQGRTAVWAAFEAKHSPHAGPPDFNLVQSNMIRFNS
jgi:hypothetical protein